MHCLVTNQITAEITNIQINRISHETNECGQKLKALKRKPQYDTLIQRYKNSLS